MTLDPLAQLSVTAMVAVILIFLLSLYLLRRTCLVPLIEFTERRAQRIDSAHANHSAAEELAAAARGEADALLANAKADADRIDDEAKRELAARRREALDKARAEADAILARGKDEVAELTRTEDATLAAELHACVHDTLGKILVVVAA